MAASVRKLFTLNFGSKCLLPLQQRQFVIQKKCYSLTSVSRSMYNPKYMEATISKEELAKTIADDDERKYRPIKAARIEQTTLFHHDPVIEKFIGMILEQGKRKLARDLVDKAFRNIKRIQIEKYHKSSEQEKMEIVIDPTEIFHQALQNCEPVLQLMRVVKGGIVYQVPIPCKPKQQRFKAMKWLIESSKDKDGKTRFHDKLAWELIEASKNQGASVRKKQELHRQCEANRAYAHFRW